MDYREREYYLIHIRSDYNNNKINLMKQIAPSLKLSAPTKHIKNTYYWDEDAVKNIWYDTTLIHCTAISHLASVRKEHHYLFRYFLESMTKANEIYFMKVDKRMLGQ